MKGELKSGGTMNMEADVFLSSVDQLEASFRTFEDGLARRGSGLTKEQMTGAAIVFAWLKEGAKDRQLLIVADKFVARQVGGPKPEVISIAKECPGHERGGKGKPCCERAGEYNGFGSDGPLSFVCPNHCSCHD